MRRSDNSMRAHEHRDAADLLPWYVNGTLEGQELERLVRHLETCGDCRSDLAQQRRLARVLRTSDELAFSPDRAFKQLRDRLDSEAELERSQPETSSDRLSGSWRNAIRGVAGPVRWALAAQLVAIVALGTALVSDRDGRDESFRTLSTPAAVAASEAVRLRIVFHEEATEADVRALLIGSGLHIVAGPTPFGVYTIEVSSGSGEGVLEVLRSSSLVTFVEPTAESAGSEP